MNVFYRLVRGSSRLFLRLIFRFRVTGAEHIPRQGAVIVVSNHTSYLDPLILGVASPRMLYFMAKAELFNVPVLRGVIARLGAFPVKRGAPDRQALRKAATILKEKRCLAVFPEGARRFDGLGKPERGTALLARQAGAVIVPAGIIGADKVKSTLSRLALPVKVEVRVGLPINVSADADKERMQEIMEETMARIAELIGEGNG